MALHFAMEIKKDQNAKLIVRMDFNYKGTRNLFAERTRIKNYSENGFLIVKLPFLSKHDFLNRSRTENGREALNVLSRTAILCKFVVQKFFVLMKSLNWAQGVVRLAMRDIEWPEEEFKCSLYLFLIQKLMFNDFKISVGKRGLGNRGHEDVRRYSATQVT